MSLQLKHLKWGRNALFWEIILTYFLKMRMVFRCSYFLFWKYRNGGSWCCCWTNWLVLLLHTDSTKQNASCYQHEWIWRLFAYCYCCWCLDGDTDNSHHLNSHALFMILCVPTVAVLNMLVTFLFHFLWLLILGIWRWLRLIL